MPPAVTTDHSSCYEFLCFDLSASNSSGKRDRDFVKIGKSASATGALSTCKNIKGNDLKEMAANTGFFGDPTMGFFTGSIKYLKGTTMALYNDYGCGLAYGLSGGASLGSTGNNPAHLLWRAIFPWHIAYITAADAAPAGTLPALNHILVDPSYASGSSSSFAMGMARVLREMASLNPQFKQPQQHSTPTRLQPFSLRPYLTHVCMERLVMYSPPSLFICSAAVCFTTQNTRPYRRTIARSSAPHMSEASFLHTHTCVHCFLGHH